LCSRSHPHLSKRTGQSICSLEIFKALQKRGVIADVGAYGSVTTIVERDMTVPRPGQTLEDYVKEQTDNDDGDPTMRRLHWTNPDRGIDVNTAEFRPLEDESFSYSLIGLVGVCFPLSLFSRSYAACMLTQTSKCTGMVILSKRDVYMAHYWENIAFNQDKETPGTEYKTQDQAFTQTVKRVLEKGIARQNEAKEQDSLRANAAAIDDDSIHGVLMIPRTGNLYVGIGPDDPYRTYWNKLKDVVHGILPRLDPNDPIRWTEYRYNRQQNEETTVDPVG
jgi:hypothetical protein